MTATEALRIALAKFDGSPTALAGAVGNGVKRQNVEYWLSVGHVPPAHCPGVERAAEGAVFCEALSTKGVQWARIPDKAWPWNKRGRPVLDVTKAAA